MLFSLKAEVYTESHRGKSHIIVTNGMSAKMDASDESCVSHRGALKNSLQVVMDVSKRLYDRQSNF